MRLTLGMFTNGQGTGWEPGFGANARHANVLSWRGGLEAAEVAIGGVRVLGRALCGNRLRAATCVSDAAWRAAWVGAWAEPATC